MKAIGYANPGPVSADDALVEFDADVPSPGPHDLLVEVRGVSVIRSTSRCGRTCRPRGADRASSGSTLRGVVTAIGSDVTRFAVGDEVYYAGDITRPGSNAECQLVDERIVGRKLSRWTSPTPPACR